MHIEHLALDGSVVSVQADVDLSRPTTRTGWAIVPSLMLLVEHDIPESGQRGQLLDELV